MTCGQKVVKIVIFHVIGSFGRKADACDFALREMFWRDYAGELAKKLDRCFIDRLLGLLQLIVFYFYFI